MTSPYRAPSYLVLATEPRLKYLEMALKNLAKHFPMDVFHCEREFISALRNEAESKRVRWDVVLRADSAKPSGNSHAVRDWENLRKLAATAARSVADQLRARTKPTLIIYPGLLARYGQLTDGRLTACEFKGSGFQDADFQGANLEGLRTERVNFSRCNLCGAKLKDADLRGADIEGLLVRAEDVRGAIVTPPQAMELARLLGLVIR